MEQEIPNGQPTSWPSTKISLLERIRDGQDAHAWETFVDLYSPLIYRYCRKRGLQEADAQDVTQNVLSNVSRVITQFQYDPTRGQFRGWLGTTTYREIQRHRGAAQRAVPGAGAGIGDEMLEQVDSEAEAAWTETFNAHMYRCAVERIRTHFDDQTWRVFHLTWEMDQAPGDVARQLKRSAHWVYKAKFRVVQRLKKELEFLASDAAIFGRANSA